VLLFSVWRVPRGADPSLCTVMFVLLDRCQHLARVFQCVVCACDLCISQEDEADPEDDNVDGDYHMPEVRAAVLRMARAAWC
jgi:hypothetical protein